MYRIQKGLRNGQAWFYLVENDPWKDLQTKDIVAGISFENSQLAGNLVEPDISRFFEVICLGWTFSVSFECRIRSGHK